MSEESYQKFLDFDWKDDRWQSYLNALYPPPNHKQILKFKKKWYKKTIEPEFDESYEPAYTPSAGSGSCGGASTSTGSIDPNSPWNNTVKGDGARWTLMGPKATICWLAYLSALLLSVAAVAGVIPTYQALVALIGSFLLEILAKYGLKFNSEYLQSVLLDDVGAMPMMSVTLLTPGLHPIVRAMSLVPPVLTALLSFATISKAHPRLPRKIGDFFAPLAGVSARYQVMQGRADAEVGLGVVLVVSVFALRSAPMAALLYWNIMMMRYMMSPWTQASFRKVDGLLDPVLGKIPLVNRVYSAIKRGLYSFVDPAQRGRSSSMCSIL